ncbi:MAG TPA: PaaI family thioesterase [Actinomycetota bacterium]|nr:PaaI family thioesterase [Actinomycetota bacterium]
MDRLPEIRERFAGSPFHSAFLGARLDRVAPDEVDVSLDVEPRHLNLSGTLHGGMIATLADTATGLAYRTGLDEAASAVTTSLSVTFLRPGGIGVVTARGRVVKRGSRFGYAEADVVDANGMLLARGGVTFTVIAAAPNQDQ